MYNEEGTVDAHTAALGTFRKAEPHQGWRGKNWKVCGCHAFVSNLSLRLFRIQFHIRFELVSSLLNCSCQFRNHLAHFELVSSVSNSFCPFRTRLMTLVCFDLVSLISSSFRPSRTPFGTRHFGQDRLDVNRLCICKI